MPPQTSPVSTRPPSLDIDPFRQFDHFSGSWKDSNQLDVMISCFGVVRYINYPKLRYDAEKEKDNEIVITFPAPGPKKQVCIGNLSDCGNFIHWNNGAMWQRVECKPVPPCAPAPPPPCVQVPVRRRSSGVLSLFRRNKTVVQRPRSQSAPVEVTTQRAQKRFEWVVRIVSWFSRKSSTSD